MKKVFMFLVVASIAVCATSCSAVSFLSGGGGMIYEGTTAPHSVTSNPISDNTRVGKSNSVTVLGMVSVGDGGINAAAKNAGIKRISHVDVQKTSILGVFSKSETIVYGE